jgi:tRNA modification GTPase
MINARHKDALERSRGGLVRSQEALGADQPLDLVALDLRAAVQAVGEVVGKTTTDDLLDRIFSRFCLGK